METKQLKEIKQYEKQVSFAEKKAGDLVIESEVDMTSGTDLLDELKTVEKAVKQRKEAITRPLMEGLSSARELFKPLEVGYANAKKITKQKMLDYTIAEEERQEEAKAKVLKRVEKGTMRVDTAVGKMEDIGEAKKSFEGTSSKTSIKKVTKIRIVDETKIPREYLVPDMKAITEAVLRQRIEVPGIETYEEKSIVGRST
jgi:hypothetical protein|tara:strand:+ start:255 stop:854 length:600 start_codon:yes stop_codon:yes gene_type:complete